MVYALPGMSLPWSPQAFSGLRAFTEIPRARAQALVPPCSLLKHCSEFNPWSLAYVSWLASGAPLPPRMEAEVGWQGIWLPSLV